MPGVRVSRICARSRTCRPGRTLVFLGAEIGRPHATLDLLDDFARQAAGS